MPALSSLTVATFIQGQYVGLLLSFNICCQLIVSIVLCRQRIHWLSYNHPIVSALRNISCDKMLEYAKNECDCTPLLQLLELMSVTEWLTIVMTQFYHDSWFDVIWLMSNCLQFKYLIFGLFFSILVQSIYHFFIILICSHLKNPPPSTPLSLDHVMVPKILDVLLFSIKQFVTVAQQLYLAWYCRYIFSCIHLFKVNFQCTYEHFKFLWFVCLHVCLQGTLISLS